jgi:hypothetical protein
MITTENTLSVYRITDNKSNLNRVAAALVANCDCISNFDYLLFNEDLLQTIGIETEHTKGNTADDSVNSWHIDLVKIPFVNLVNLVDTASKCGQIGRVSEKEIEKFLAEGFMNGYINRETVKLKKGEIEKIEKIEKLLRPT